jgi:hypothetical protein
MLSRVPVAAFLIVLSLPAYCQSPPANTLTNVPDFVLYDHFLFRVVWLENQANSLKAQGKDDTFMRSWMQTKAGLTSQETASLKAIAADCRNTTSAIVGSIQTLAAAGTSLAASPQAQSLVSQQRQAVLDHTTGRNCTLVLAITAGALWPKAAIRLVCFVLLAGDIFITGFSVGPLYIPALGFTFLAAVAQMRREGESRRSGG